MTTGVTNDRVSRASVGTVETAIDVVTVTVADRTVTALAATTGTGALTTTAQPTVGTIGTIGTEAGVCATTETASERGGEGDGGLPPLGETKTVVTGGAARAVRGPLRSPTQMIVIRIGKGAGAGVSADSWRKSLTVPMTGTWIATLIAARSTREGGTALAVKTGRISSPPVARIFPGWTCRGEALLLRNGGVVVAAVAAWVEVVS